MANGDGLDEMEFKSLQGAVTRVEALVAYASPGARLMYEQFLGNARARLSFLEKEIKEHKEIEEKHERGQASAVTMSALAQRETALSEGEKKTFSGFLAEEFFAKKDFSRLEQFYSQSWERLSEGGKAEMSHRVWEGIRRDEYKFTDLPQIVQEKEAKWAYSKLTAPSINQSSLAQIPEADRNDFTEAYRSGDNQRAYHILNRDGFRHGIALETSTGVNHQATDTGKAVDDQAIVKNATSANTKSSKPSNVPAEPVQIADINLDAVKLKDVKLADVNSAPSVASIPNVSGPQINER